MLTAFEGYSQPFGVEGAAAHRRRMRAYGWGEGDYRYPVRFGPRQDIAEPEDWDKVLDRCKEILDLAKKGNAMHYRNGREAKNGDPIVHLNHDGTSICAIGYLVEATPGNDYCNGRIAQIQAPGASACLCDCLHMDDVAALLKEKGLERRPPGR